MKLVNILVFLSLLVQIQSSQAEVLSGIPLLGIDRIAEVKGLLGKKGASYEPQSIAGQFNANTMFLAEQLDANADQGVRSRATVVSSIVELGDLRETTPLGLLLSEHLAHHLKIRGWIVSEPRMANALQFKTDGEFGLSRDVDRISANVSAQNVVTGTYIATRDGVLVSVRVLDFASGRVVSSAQTRLLRNSFSREMLGGKVIDTPRIKITN